MKRVCRRRLVWKPAMASSQRPFTAILFPLKPSEVVIQEIPQRQPRTALTFPI